MAQSRPPPKPIDLPAPPKPPAVAPALQQAADNAHAKWKKDDGGAEFYPGLTYPRGLPTLMLVTSKGEPADKQLRRQKAIIAACDFLLDDGAFGEFSVCVVETDRANPKALKTGGYKLKRSDFKQAVKAATKLDDVKAGARQAKGNDDTAKAISAQLGIK